MSCLILLTLVSLCALIVKSNFFKLTNFSQECERKDSAELFPKNFALIRLAEKTLKKLNQEKDSTKIIANYQKAQVEKVTLENRSANNKN